MVLNKTAGFLFALAALLSAQDQSHELTITVTNSVTGEPIPHAVMNLLGKLQTTNTNGTVSVEAPAPGVYPVVVERTGFTNKLAQVEVHSGNQQDVALKSVPWGAISGRVVNADGEPLDGVSVYAEHGETSTNENTDEKGRFRIGKLAPGTYRLKAVKDEQSYLPPEIRTDGTSEVHYVTAFALNIALRAGSETQGVELRMTGVPVVGIRGKIIGIPAGSSRVMVALEPDRDRWTGVNSDGSFAIWRVDPGHYSIGAFGKTLRGSDFQTEWAEVEVGSTNVDRVDLRVVAAASIRCHLEFGDEQARQILHPAASPAPSRSGVAAGGQAGNGARVTLTDLSGSESAAAEIGDDDLFVLPDVDVGKYRVKVEGMAGVYVRAMRLGQAEIDGTLLDLSHGVSGNAELSLIISSATGSISGTVRDKQGSPVAKVNIMLQKDSTGLGQQSAADGTYELIGLAPGKYRLAVGDNDDEDAGEEIEIQPGDKISKDLVWPSSY